MNKKFNLKNKFQNNKSFKSARRELSNELYTKSAFNQSIGVNDNSIFGTDTAQHQSILDKADDLSDRDRQGPKFEMDPGKTQTGWNKQFNASHFTQVERDHTLPSPGIKIHNQNKTHFQSDGGSDLDPTERHKRNYIKYIQEPITARDSLFMHQQKRKLPSNARNYLTLRVLQKGCPKLIKQVDQHITKTKPMAN